MIFNKKQETVVPTEQIAAQSQYGAPESYGEENCITGIDLLGDQLVAYDQAGTAYSINNPDDLPGTFRIERLHRDADNTYYAVANTGQAFEISHDLYGQLSGSNPQVGVSEQSADGFYERRLSPTKGKIEIGGRVWWETEHPEDYASAKIGALAHLIGQGRLAEQSLRAVYAENQQPQDMYQQDHSTADPRYQEVDLTPDSRLQAPQYPVEVYHSDDYQTTVAPQPVTLAEELMGTSGQTAPELSVSNSAETADTSSSENARNARKNSVGRRIGRSLGKTLIKGTVEVAVVLAVGVPAAHTMVEAVGSKIPFVKIDQNDTMAFSMDPAHDLKVLAQGPFEFLGTVQGMAGKVGL